MSAWVSGISRSLYSPLPAFGRASLPPCISVVSQHAASALVVEERCSEWTTVRQRVDCSAMHGAVRRHTPRQLSGLHCNEYMRY